MKKLLLSLILGLLLVGGYSFANIDTIDMGRYLSLTATAKTNIRHRFYAQQDGYLRTGVFYNTSFPYYQVYDDSCSLIANGFMTGNNFTGTYGFNIFFTGGQSYYLYMNNSGNYDLIHRSSNYPAYMFQWNTGIIYLGNLYDNTIICATGWYATYPAYSSNVSTFTFEYTSPGPEPITVRYNGNSYSLSFDTLYLNGLFHPYTLSGTSLYFTPYVFRSYFRSH